METVLAGLEPRLVWQHFAAIAAIPHPSGHEQKLREVLAGWARGKGFESFVDGVGNLLIRVPASPGREGGVPLVLQGHLDMVAEKNKDVEFDFLKEGIKLRIDGEWLKATGTTLGADNGIGVAMALAIAEDPTVVHPPLELLFTIEEETGLTGATGLLPGALKGKFLINIDSEEEGHIFTGCAGGCDTTTSFPLSFQELEEGFTAVAVQVKGLIGGHSGLTIHQNRANALRVLAFWLRESAREMPLAICELAGGDKHNAIPREATAVVVGPQGLAECLQQQADRLQPRLMQEYGRIDPGLTLKVNRAGANQAISVEDSLRLLNLLLVLPHGVDAMSKEIPGMVETSSNLARVKWEEEEALVLNSSRSSVAFALERMKSRISSIAQLAGVTATHGHGYPGWQPNLDSRLLQIARQCYQDVTGKEAVVTAIHAGLECGIIGEKHPGMEMLSIGPDMFDVHSPNEKLSIPSTGRFYDYLKALVSHLAESRV